MKKSLQLLLGAAVMSTVSAESVLGCELENTPTCKDKYDYKTNGKDWPGVKIKVGGVSTNECGDKKVPQSPIDLKNSWPTVSNLVDQFSKVYTDQIGGIVTPKTSTTPAKTSPKVLIDWNGHTSHININIPNQDIQTFYSHSANVNYKAPQRWNGVQFHFHAGSEHTIEGKRQDLEMHTVHLPFSGHGPLIKYDGYAAAAMGIMFSVKEPSRTFEAWETKIIDDFFDSLLWTQTDSNPSVDKVSYGKIMMMFDMQNRWTYKGSVTTPPCATAVYWNVLKTVYPIKQKHLDQFKKQLARKPGLEKTGNWREIQPYLEGDTGHKALIVDSSISNVGMLIAVIVLAVFVFVLLLVVIKMRMMLKKGAAGSTEMSSQVQPISGDSGYNSQVNEGK